MAKAADCVPNVHVIFTPDPQAQLDDIAKRRDVLIGFHFPAQLKALTTASRPIQALVRHPHARHLGHEPGLRWRHWLPARSAHRALRGERPIGRAGSRLGNDMSVEVVHTLVLADANKVAGEKIDAVADYIAVLALAKWQNLAACNRTIPTILNLMAEGCDAQDRPEAATGVDVALLTGLYTVEARELGSQQRMAIAGRMQSELDKAGKAH